MCSLWLWALWADRPLEKRCLYLPVSDSSSCCVREAIPWTYVPLVVLVAEVTPILYWMYLNFKLSSWTSPSGSHCCVLHWKRDSFPKTQAVRPFSMTLVARALVISYLGSKFTVCLFTSCLDCPSWGTVFMPGSSCWSSVHSSWWTDHWQEHKVPLVICLGSARHCIAAIS